LHIVDSVASESPYRQSIGRDLNSKTRHLSFVSGTQAQVVTSEFSGNAFFDLLPDAVGHPASSSRNVLEESEE
jgi:hypothetical protein